MDVKKIQAAALPALAGKKGKPEEPRGAEFQKILQQAQSNRKADETTDTALARGGGRTEFYADPALSISAVSFTGFGDESTLQREGALASERALGLLEGYQNAMGDGNRPIREVWPLLRSLSAELKGLTEWAGKLPPSDPLQKIMTEIGVLSAVEIEKFNRGDYG